MDARSAAPGEADGLSLASTVHLRYFAAAKAAAGVAEEECEVGEGCSIGVVLGASRLAGHPVLGRSTFLVNGVATTDRAQILGDGDLLDVLPPFAGG